MVGKAQFYGLSPYAAHLSTPIPKAAPESVRNAAQPVFLGPD